MTPGVNTRANESMLRQVARHTLVAWRAAICWLVIFALAVPPVMLAESIVMPAIAYGQTYAVGNAKYQKGDFAGAEAALSSALSSKQSSAERAKTLKVLGICQFMLGKKGAAETSFKKALAIDGKTKVGADEVLDDSVIPFFNGVKAKAGKPANSAQAKPAAKPKAAAPAPQPQPTAAGGAAKPLKQTFIKVVSNVPTATVLIDGIIAGQVNALINTDPGQVEVEVQASGYITRKVGINVGKNRENSITVNLAKPAPKPVPKPKPKPAPVAKTKPKGPNGGPGGGYALGGGKKKKKPGGTYAPKPADDLFGDEPDGGGGGGGGGGQPPGGPDLATQFQMDAGGGGGGYMPPPGYGAQPMGYGYPQQQPMYYAPPPQMYYQPPPPPPPPVDPYGGGGDPYGGGAPADPYAAGPADPGAGDAGGGGGGGGKNDKNIFLAVMPFGIGQFQNKSYMLGLFFLGAEGASLYYWQAQTKLADETVATANKYLNENCATTATGSTLQGETVSKEKCDAYRATSSKFVDDKRKAATMGLAAFGVLWIGGAIEAVIHDPPASKSKKKKPKKRKYGGFGSTSDYDYEEVAEWAPSQDDDDRPYHVLEMAAERRPEVVFRWDLGLLPPGAAPLVSGYDAGSPVSSSGGEPPSLLRPGVALDLRWSF